MVVFVGTEKFLVDILQEHLETLEMLWTRRLATRHSPEETLRSVSELEDRIEAHSDGLVLAHDHAMPILVAALGRDDLCAVLAAAHVLLRLQDQAAADLVMDTLVDAQGEQVDGLRQALSQGPLDLVGKRLKDLYDSGPPRLAAVAAEVFASHGRLRVSSKRLREFYEDEDIVVRRAAWRITALVGTEDKP